MGKTKEDLGKKYSLLEERLEIGGSGFSFVRPVDAYALVEGMTESDFGDEEKMPYWAELWPSAIGLAKVLAGMEGLKGVRCLELGCGMGLAGLVAASRGAKVIATDWYEEALDFVEANALLNGLQVGTEILDWNQPLANYQYPLILGADLLYERRNLPLVVSVLGQMLEPEGVALLTDPARDAAKGFSQLGTEAGFCVEREILEVLWAEKTHTIHLYRMRRGR